MIKLIYPFMYLVAMKSNRSFIINKSGAPGLPDPLVVWE